MRFPRLTAALCLAAALSAAAPALALDEAELEKRVAASLSLSHDLDGPTYVELVRAVRPKKLYDRSRDYSIPPFHESGLWRVHVPIKVDLAAVVITFDGSPYLLGLDNFAWPRVSRSKIDPRPFERAITRAISFR